MVPQEEQEKDDVVHEEKDDVVHEEKKDDVVHEALIDKATEFNGTQGKFFTTFLSQGTRPGPAMTKHGGTMTRMHDQHRDGCYNPYCSSLSTSLDS